MEDTITLTRASCAEPSLWRRRSLVTGGAVLLMFLLGWLDYATGWELSVFVFYVVPILLVVWQGEMRLAIILAVLSGVVWWLANLGDHPYRSELSYHWASLGRTAYFVLVALGGNAIWARQRMDRLMIETLEHMRQLEREIVAAGEHEQQRIGRDLHDSLCQNLSAIGFAARSLADDLCARSLPEAQQAGEIEELLRDSVVQARDLARGICPVFSGGVELEAALDELARTAKRLTGMEVSFRNECGAQMVEPDAAMHLFRIAQEALNNKGRSRMGSLSLTHSQHPLLFNMDASSFTYDLFSLGSVTPTGDFNSVTVNSVSLINNLGVWTGANGSVTYEFDQGFGDLVVTAVPEPGAALIGSLGLLALLRRRRN